MSAGDAPTRVSGESLSRLSGLRRIDPTVPSGADLVRRRAYRRRRPPGPTVDTLATAEWRPRSVGGSGDQRECDNRGQISSAAGDQETRVGRADPANALPAGVSNSGTVRSDAAGDGLVVDPAAFQNQAAGTVEATGGGTVRFATAPANYAPATGTLAGGTWAVGGGSSLLFPPAVTVNAGTLALSGGYDLTVGSAGATFRNAGRVQVGPGSVLAFAGDLVATAAARTEVALSGPPTADAFGRLTVGGTATLGGTAAPTSASGTTAGGYSVLSAAAAVSCSFAAVLPIGQTKVSDWYSPAGVRPATVRLVVGVAEGGRPRGPAAPACSGRGTAAAPAGRRTGCTRTPRHSPPSSTHSSYRATNRARIRPGIGTIVGTSCPRGTHRNRGRGTTSKRKTP